MRGGFLTFLLFTASPLLASSITQERFEQIGNIVKSEMFSDVLQRSNYRMLEIRMNWDNEDSSGGGAGARGVGELLKIHVNGFSACKDDLE